MKTAITILCVFMSVSVFAQNTIFAGKITEKGKPAQGARIYAKGSGAQTDAQSDELGLYRAQDLPEGDYTITVILNGKRKVSGKVHLTYLRGEKRYYLLEVGEKGLSITTTDKNLFIEAKLERVGASDQNIDVIHTGVIGPERNQQVFYVPKGKIKVEQAK